MKKDEKGEKNSAGMLGGERWKGKEKRGKKKEERKKRTNLEIIAPPNILEF